MVKIMGKYTGCVYYSCQNQKEANEWICAKEILEPLVILVLPREKLRAWTRDMAIEIVDFVANIDD